MLPARQASRQHRQSDEMTTRPLIIDCDTGRDDALSIWLALARHMNLAGVVTSYGNTIVENVSENSARVLALSGRDDIPLWQGAAAPSRTHSGYTGIVRPRQEKSGNGLCNLELPEAGRKAVIANSQQLAAHLKKVSADQGAIDYIILGPATNFAAVCAVLGDDAHDIFASVTMMGGKMDALWTQIPGADFNLVCDPFAVRDLLKQGREHGFPVRFVPMNVTWPIVMGLDALETLQSSTDIGRTACDLMIAHARYFAPEPVFRFHDPCVILALDHLSAFRAKSLDIVCDDKSPDFGRLIETPQGMPGAVLDATDEMRTAFLSEILERLSINRT